MGVLALFVLVLVALLPIAWLVSEFWSKRRSVRCTLGILAILCCFAVAWLAAQVVRFQYNTRYGGASKKLIDASVERLEAGDSHTVLREWKALQQQFRPTYENRAGFDRLATETARKIKAGGSGDSPAKPPHESASPDHP